MDGKDSLMFLVLLLLSLGLFGSLSLTYCVWNRQTEVASELQSELHELQKRSEIADIRNEQCSSKLQSEVQDLKYTNSKLQSELADVKNELHELQNELKDTNSREHLGASEPFQDKGRLMRNVRQADDDPDSLSATEILTNALTEIIERKLVSFMNCDKNEYNHTKCTLKPGPKGEPGPEGEKGTKGELGDKGHRGEPGNKGTKGNVGYPGYKGEKGREDEVGPQGLSDMGERDLKGDMGPPGPKGETGGRGDMGQKGEPGDKGAKGEKGDRGAAGPQGSKGNKGIGVGVPCGGPGWRRVVFLNMTNTSHVCPAGLNLTNYSRRTCGRAHSGWYSCSSTTFSVGGSQYSRVCGRALAYRFGENFAFCGYHYNRQDINGYYVDGLSLTHGAPGSRQHIWTFASGLFAGSRSSSYSMLRCPCDNGNTYPSPPFVGNDYFCESVTQSSWAYVFYPDALLWDGQVCEGGGTCCQFNNPPWFTKNLARYTTEDIELRLCIWYYRHNADIALEQLELYVQ